MAERYLAFLRKGFSPLEVVAVTFTERAALELRNRVRARVQEEEGLENKEKLLAELEAAPIGTLHALAARICREFPEEAEVPGDFQVMDDLEARLLLGEWVEEALLEALKDSKYAPLVEAVGYEGLLATLEKVAEDPLSAQEALAKGLEVRKSLRQEAWGRLHERVDNLLRGQGEEALEAIPGLLEAWRAAKPEDPETAAGLLDWAEGVRFNENRWRDLKASYPFLEQLRDLLAPKNSSTPPRLFILLQPADQILEEVWPLLKELAEKVLGLLEARRFQARRLGYADLEVHALRALGKKEVRRYYRSRFRRLLVDEFQDTNPVQYRLLRALFPNLCAWTLVGDPNQSIYSFRRADPRVMEKVLEEARAAEEEVLSLRESFRYHQGLADFHNRFFPQLLPQYQQVEARRPSPGEGPWVFHFQGSLEDQARLIAQEVRRLHKEGFRVYDRALGDYRPLAYQDVAVLARTWKDLAQVAEIFQDLGVPAVEARGGDLLETREFLDAYLALRFLADPKDEEALAGLLRSPFFALTDGEIRALAEARGKGESLWDALRRKESPSPEAARARGVLETLLGRKAYEAPSRLLQRLDLLTGYTGVVALLPRGRRRVKDWEGTLELVRELEVGAEDPFLVVRHLRLLLREGVTVERPPLEAGNALTLITIHSAKGLEWPVVFVLNAGQTNGKGPWKTRPLFRPGLALVPPVLDKREEPSAFFRLVKARLAEEEAAEERRLLYVAATRAGERLYLLLPEDQGTIFAPAEAEEAGSKPVALAESEGDGLAPQEDKPQPRRLTVRLPRLPLEAMPISLLALAAKDPDAARKRLLGEPLGEGDVAVPEAPETLEEAEAPGGASVGTMAHALLERFDSGADLNRGGLAFLQEAFPGAEEKEREEALRLAQVFFTHEAFARFRKGPVAKEVPVALEVEGCAWRAGPTGWGRTGFWTTRPTRRWTSRPTASRWWPTPRLWASPRPTWPTCGRMR